MFLFTSINRADNVGGGVSRALRDAAQATGVDFSYLLDTAKRESALNPEAKARSSSAAGLFQFIENTWLGAVQQWGEQYGLGKYAEAINAKGNGGYAVDDPKTRREILALRFDPQVSAYMAGEFTKDNADMLQKKIGRQPNGGELYIAHFLGSHGASRLINMAADHPDAAAADYFPAAARANKSIFYGRKGAPRRAADVYQVLVARHSASSAAAPIVGQGKGPMRLNAYAQQRAPDPLFASLFSTDAAMAAPAKTSAASARDGHAGPLGNRVQAMWLNFFGQASDATVNREPSDPARLDVPAGGRSRQARVAVANDQGAERRVPVPSRHNDPSLLVR